MSDINRDQIERLMKRCQIGVDRRHAPDEAHDIMLDIMAECYGTLGAMWIEIEKLKAQLWHMRATAAASVSRDLYDAHTEELRAALDVLEKRT